MNEYQKYIDYLKNLNPRDFDMLVATEVFGAVPKNIITKKQEEYSGFILNTGEWYTDENLIEFIGSDESLLPIIRIMDDRGFEIYVAISKMSDGSSGKVIGFLQNGYPPQQEHPSIICQNLDVYNVASAALLALKFRKTDGA